jgi:hypothetical protein
MWLRDIMAGIGLLLFVSASFAMASLLPLVSASG